MPDKPRKSPSVAFNHVGICVTDLSRARRFYEEALGFSYWWEMKPADIPTSTLLQVPAPLSLRAVYMFRDGLVLELLHYAAGEHPPRQRRRMDEPGLTHVSLAVENMAETLDAVRRLGGTVLDDTDVGAAVMVSDPDGQLIELTGWAWRSVLPPLPT